MKKLFAAISLLLLLSCTQGGDALKKCLDPEERNLAETISNETYIVIYNRVAQKDNEALQEVIDTYFGNGLRISASMGTMDTICPNYGFTSALMSFLDKGTLDRFVDYDPDTHRFAIKKEGKYSEILARLSHRNAFFKGFYHFFQQSDGCTGLPYIIAINYKNIDFEKEDERFVALLALLTRPDGSSVPFSK